MLFVHQVRSLHKELLIRQFKVNLHPVSALREVGKIASIPKLAVEPQPLLRGRPVPCRLSPNVRSNQFRPVGWLNAKMIVIDGLQRGLHAGATWRRGPSSDVVKQVVLLPSLQELLVKRLKPLLRERHKRPSLPPGRPGGPRGRIEPREPVRDISGRRVISTPAARLVCLIPSADSQ